MRVPAQMLICPLLARSRTSRAQHATNAHTIYTALNLDEIFSDVLPAWKHGCMLVPYISRERSCDLVHYNCLDSLTAVLKQTTAFYMIAHLYHDLYQGVLGWFRGLASELELAHSGAVHPANSPLPGPWCQCQ
jgi:hypothetical protein